MSENFCIKDFYSFTRNSDMPSCFEVFVSVWYAGWFVNMANNWTFNKKSYESSKRAVCIESHMFKVPLLMTFLFNK